MIVEGPISGAGLARMLSNPKNKKALLDFGISVMNLLRCGGDV